MKTRFTTYDLVCVVNELQKYVGMRVAQVYDIDNKTYLIKLQKPEEKCVFLLESGNRIHTTAFEWPKNVAPSQFSMKMRKHLRNKRLECLRQLGLDRIVDLQFGSGEAAYHVILELYDRGNIILTDCDLMIINILRPHTENEVVRFAVREKYPMDRAHERKGPPSLEELQDILSAAKPGENLKKVLNPHLEYGAAVIEHCLLTAGFSGAQKVDKSFDMASNLPRICEALQQADKLIDDALKQPSQGYIIQKKERRPRPDGTEEDFYTNQEFHPMIFEQHRNQSFKQFPTFDMAVDEFFSMVESQKIDMKAVQQEREALKKLANVRKDHDQRLEALERTQETDKQRAELITRNQQLVDNAILSVRSALANQMSWPDIQELIKEAQARKDPVAMAIKGLKLEVNHITLLLSDPYIEDDFSDEDEDSEHIKPMTVDIDLDLTCYANARKYYDQKKHAAKKQQKTIESHGKALRSAEKKTKQTLKDVQAITNINKARKVYWFEKFFWFISSENYLVIGGRDQQQNELIVKRYMRAGDVYVHADIQGASSIVVKNPTGQSVPPKTLNEAGVMAVSYSVAWDAKVVTSAWWVQSDQVSKTAPTGEYLTTGSFMVRGKKNYLPPCHLIMGFSFLFKLADSSVERHKDERKVRSIEDDAISMTSELTLTSENDNDQEIELDDSDGEDEGSGDNETKSGKSHCETIVEDVKEENNDKRNSESDSSDQEETSKGETSENNLEFPDTEIKIELNKDNQITLQTKGSSLIKESSEDQESHVVFLGDDKPVIIKPRVGRQRKPSETKGREKKNSERQEDTEDNSQGKQPPVKRGQKAKLKKIKEKYKFQDDEERTLRMEILQSAGSGKESKKGKKGKETKGSGKGEKTLAPRMPRPAAPKNPTGEGDDSDGAEEPTVVADVDMLNFLTGIPVTEDELLFAVPIVAPYNTLQNYKFKVKLTPGTGKRGKAAKTALNIFLKDKTTVPREKDLIRSVKDEDLARNIPGKVKVSAPQLQKHKK